MSPKSDFNYMMVKRGAHKQSHVYPVPTVSQPARPSLSHVVQVQ